MPWTLDLHDHSSDEYSYIERKTVAKEKLHVAGLAACCYCSELLTFPSLLLCVVCHCSLLLAVSCSWLLTMLSNITCCCLLLLSIISCCYSCFLLLLFLFVACSYMYCCSWCCLRFLYSVMLFAFTIAYCCLLLLTICNCLLCKQLITARKSERLYTLLSPPFN